MRRANLANLPEQLRYFALTMLRILAEQFRNLLKHWTGGELQQREFNDKGLTSSSRVLFIVFYIFISCPF